MEFGDLEDEFWITIRGPLGKQPDAIDVMVEALRGIEGVDVAGGLAERAGRSWRACG